MTNAELAKYIRVGMFATRPTVADAYEYATRLIEGMHTKDQGAALTALHVVMNAIADEIERCKESANA